MTMQTNTLPFQVAGANATQRAATPDRLADAARDTGAFGATLNREMAARQPAPQPPQAAQGAKPVQQAKPATADKPTVRDPVREGPTRATVKPPVHESESKTTTSTAKAAAAEGAEAPADTATATATATVKDAASGTDPVAQAADALALQVAGDDAAAVPYDADRAAQAAEAAAASSVPIIDMLAFMASLSQPATVAAVLPAVAAGAGATATTTTATVDSQLTALDNTKAIAGALTDRATGGNVVADAPANGPVLATGVEQAPVELRTAVAALPQGDHDAAQFQAQLRETLQPNTPAAEAAPAPLAALQAQAAKLDAAGNPAAVPGDRIAARVGTQAWDNQVSQRIVYMVGKEQAATLTLNPPDLGPVQIVLNVSNDQATVAFSSDQLEVRQALENAMPRLREMMSESGILLGNATVDAGAPHQRQQQDSERRAQNGAGGTGGLEGDGTDAMPALNEVAPRTRTVALGDRGMVDLFA